MRRVPLLAALLPLCLGLLRSPRREEARAAPERAPPDFWACETEAETCQPEGSPEAPSSYTGALLERGYGRMRSLAASGRRPLALHVGADGLRNRAKWTDMHLYGEVLNHSGLPPGALRLAFVEPIEDKALFFWARVAALPVALEQVSLTAAMMDGECSTPTKSLWRFGLRAYNEFRVNRNLMSGWVSADPRHAPKVLRGWVDRHQPCPCESGLESCREGFERLSRVPNMTEYLEELRVPCLTLSGLLRGLGAEPRDLAMLVVDAEGLDAAIIAPLASDPSFRPGFVMWEGVYDRSGGSRELAGVLRGRGYKIGEKPGGVEKRADSANVVAVLPE